MLYLILLLLSIIPTVILGSIIYKEDKIEKEPTSLLVGLMASGLLAIVITLIITMIIYAIFPNYEEFMSANLFTCFIYVFMTIGLVEEFSKWLMTYLFTWNNKNFKHVFDGIVYAAFVSLGFATLENIAYIFLSTAQDGVVSGFTTGLFRMFLSVPGHAFFGATMGYYYSLARKSYVNKNMSNYKKYIYMSIFLPTLFHSIFDFLLEGASLLFDQGNDTLGGLLVIGYFIFVVFLYYFGIRKIIELAKVKENFVTVKGETINNYQVPHANYCRNCGIRLINMTNYCSRCGIKL